jgi:hypothetical protein
MYNVPFTTVLCPDHRLHASVGESARLTTMASGFASTVLRGIVFPWTPSGVSPFIETKGSMMARTKANIPNRRNLVDMVFWLAYEAGTSTTEGRASSSSATDSQSLSSSFAVSPKTSFRLRNRTVRAGRKCLNDGAFGAGLLTSFIVSSATSPTSVNIDRRSWAGSGRTRAISKLVGGNGRPSVAACDSCCRQMVQSQKKETVEVQR